MVFIDIYIEQPLDTADLLISFEALVGSASLVSLGGLVGQLSASWRQEILRWQRAGAQLWHVDVPQ